MMLSRKLCQLVRLSAALGGLLAPISTALAQTTLNLQVSTGTDNADQETSGTVWVDDSYAVLGSSYSGYRFQNVTIPQGATITSATLELRAYVGGITSFTNYVTAEDADSTAAFSSSSYNISNRSRTTAQVIWSEPSQTFTDGQVLTSPDIASVVQEVVDRGGWSSGTSLAIILTPVSGAKGVYKHAGNSSYAAKLDITYTGGGGGSSTELVYLSTTGGATLGGLSFADEDIVEYDPDADTATMHFDAGSVTGSDIDAVHIRDNGKILLSTKSGTSIGDLSFSDEDVVEYDPSTGVARIYFDGSAVFSSDEEIDAVCLLRNGNLVLSTSDSATIGGLNFENEDLVEYNRKTGVATLLFDGSSVFSGDEDLNAAHVRSNGKILLSTTGNATIGSLSFGDDDLVEYDPGTSQATLYFDGGNLFSNSDEDVDAVSLESEWLGLMAHWSFNEGSGTTIADDSGNGHDASFNTGTPAWISGARSGALEFDGTNDAATDSTLDPPAAGAVSVWILSDGPPASRERLWGLNADFEMWQDTDGLVSMDVSTDGYQGGFITDTPLYDAGRWYHIVAQYDSDDDSYEIYINGQLHKSGVSTWSITDQAAGILSFGTRTGSTQRFSGALDDFRIYDRWLDQSEIAELYGLVGHWKLDESSGSVAADSSGAGNSGAYQNASPGGSGPFPGRGDTAAQFSGGTDRVDLPDMQYDFKDGLTAAFWVHPTAAPTSGGFFNFFDISNGADADEVWLGWVESVGFQLYMTDNLDSSSLRTIEDNTAFEVDQWVHCIAVVDSSGNATLYRDGQVTKSGFFTSLPTSVTRTETSIAKSPLSDALPGRMHDVRLYNRAITQAEVADLYGLIGWWKLDESSGSTAQDATTANNAAAVLGSPTWDSGGKVDGALELNGSTQSLSLNRSMLNGLDGFALAGWFRPESTTPDVSLLGQNDLIEFGIDHQSNQLDLWTTNGGSAAASHQLALLQWAHLAAVGSGSNLKIYVNGVEAGSGGSSTADYGANTDVFNIGQGVLDASGDFFEGMLDDLRVYNRAISPDEVQGLFNAGATGGMRIIQWVEAR